MIHARVRSSSAERDGLVVVALELDPGFARLVDDAVGEDSTRAHVIDARGGYAAVRADALVSIARSVLDAPAGPWGDTVSSSRPHAS